MKVVMVGPYPEPGAAVSGGVERVIDSLLPHLAERVDLTLVVPGAMSDSSSRKFGVDIHYLKRGFGPGALRSSTFDAQKLACLVNSLKPDLIHLQGIAGFSRFINTPKVLTIHGIAHQDLLLSSRGDRWGQTVKRGAVAFLKRTERSARKRMDGIIVINPYVKEALPDIELIKNWSIPNPLSEHFICKNRAFKKKKICRLISIGRITPLKNTLGIIEICEQVIKSDPAVELVICGSGGASDYEYQCRAFVSQKNLEGSVKFVGNLSTELLISNLDQSSVLIMSSRQENSPMAIAEANARGVPVVAPKEFGIKYMIEEGENGFFLPNTDIISNSHVLKRALVYPWKRHDIARSAADRYSPQAVVEATLSAYAEVLARPAG